MSARDEARFNRWMIRVDDYLLEHVGCAALDLPDIDYWSLWDAGYTPAMAGTRVINYVF